MCDVCNGMTLAEMERRNDLLIRVCGFMVQQVEASAPWSYTVGLAETCDSPEFVVLDGCSQTQGWVLKELGEEIVEGNGNLQATLDLLDVALVEPFVEDLELGLVAVWEHRYARAARPDDFRQVVLGPSWRK